MYLKHSNVTTQALIISGGTGDIGDQLDRVVFYAPLVAAVTVYDGDSVVMVFPIGVGPASIEIGAQSKNGPWKITVGALDGIMLVGEFS